MIKILFDTNANFVSSRVIRCLTLQKCKFFKKYVDNVRSSSWMIHVTQETVSECISFYLKHDSKLGCIILFVVFDL